MSGAPDPLVFDLSSRAKLHISGPDALRFLNGQLTNDVRKASCANVVEACVLNAKGKMDAHVFISAINDGFLIDAEPELREALRARLDRYIIADDVTVEDVTTDWSLFHALGGDGASPDSISARRFEKPGGDIWIEATQYESVRADLKQRFVPLSAEQAETYRIERGIPRWGRELTNEIIPTEANLQHRAIDFGKGCYIGQEVISRMKMSGQTNKRLCGLIAQKPGVLKPLAHLRSETREREVGWVTSVTRSGRLNAEIGLGFVKRGFNATGTRLAVGEGELNVEIADLPFV